MSKKRYMKYKVGDKVKIKKQENFTKDAERDFNGLPNRVGMISKVEDGTGDSISYYMLEGLPWAVPERHIEGLEEEIKYTKYNRFEIMDI